MAKTISIKPTTVITSPSNVNKQEPSSNYGSLHSERGGDGDSKKVVMLSGCVVAVTILLVIFFMLIFWNRSKIKAFFKVKNKAIVVKMLGCNRQTRRNAITSATFGNFYVEDYDHKNSSIKSQVYSIGLDGLDNVKSSSDLEQEKQKPIGLDVRRYSSYNSLKLNLDEKDTSQNQYAVPSLVIPELRIIKAVADETVRNVRPTALSKTNEATTTKTTHKIEIVRTYSQGRREHNKITKQPGAAEIIYSFNNHALTKSREHITDHDGDIMVGNENIQNNNNIKNNQEHTIDIDIDPTTTSGGAGSDVSVEILDDLLGDLDTVYSKVKRKRISESYKQASSPTTITNHEKGDGVQTISVGIYAEKDQKVYYPGLVINVKGDDNSSKRQLINS